MGIGLMEQSDLKICIINMKLNQLTKCALFLMFFYIGSQQALMAQGLTNFKWENRLLLIIGDDPSGELLFTQYTVDDAQNEERKLIPILVDEMGYFNSENRNYIFDKTVFTQYGTNRAFSIILIGLDGGVKATFTEAVSLNEVHALIDQMPIRKNELKEN